MANSFNLAVFYLQNRRLKKLVQKRRRRDICESHEPSFDIPYELQIEILTKLPVKSLMRFKSVSTLWLSLIRSQFFIHRYLKVSSPSPRIYMWLSFEDSPHKKVLLSSSPSSSSFVVDQNLIIPVIEGYSVSHVYRGLMCFVNGLSAQIYNTSTRQLVVLPDIEELKLITDGELMWKIMYYIGYDLVHNQYKVVCSVTKRPSPAIGFITETWVLLLGGNVSCQWRKISKPIDQPHLPTRRKGSSLIINERMYYTVFAQYSPIIHMLVSIDLRSEEISFLQKPEHSDSADLIEFNGKVALLDYSGLKEHGVMNLWVMEDAEKHIWSSKALVLDPSSINGISLRTQGTTRTGEVIFVPDKIMVKPQSQTLFYVFVYNIQNNVLRKVEIKESSNSNRTKILDVIGFVDVDNLMCL